MVSNWFTGLRSKTKIALEIIRTICIRCNCNQSVESSWFLLILIINEYEDKNHWKRPPSLSSCSTGTVTFLCLFKNNDWLLCRWLCCWWRFKGAGVRASGRSPPLPLYNRPFCHFPSHPATSLPQAVAIIVSHWEAEAERKIISLIVSRIKLYVYLKVEGGDFDG